jgi:hypothetical protein
MRRDERGSLVVRFVAKISRRRGDVQRGAGFTGRVGRWLWAYDARLSAEEQERARALERAETMLRADGVALHRLAELPTAVGRSAQQVSRRIDEFLSENGGLHMRAVARLVTAGSSGTDPFEHAYETFEALHSESDTLQQLDEDLRALAGRLDVLGARYAAILPNLWRGLVVESELTGRVARCSTAQGASIFVSEVEDIERELAMHEQRLIKLEGELRPLIDSDAAMGAAAPNLGSLEEHVGTLADRVRRASADRISAARLVTLSSADRHMSLLRPMAGKKMQALALTVLGHMPNDALLRWAQLTGATIRSPKRGGRG